MAGISPDGSQITFIDSNSKDLWVMNSDGSQARSLYKPESGYHLFAPTFLPSGRRILYVKFRNRSGQSDLILESRDLNGSNPVLLVSNPNIRAMTWAQPGRLILTVLEAPPRQQESNLWQIECDGETGKAKTAMRRLTNWPEFYFSAVAATADGKTLAFQNTRLQSDVYIGQLSDGGTSLKTPERLTLDQRYDWPTAWTGDNKSVYFYSDLGGTFDVYRQNLNQREMEKLTTGPDAKWAPQLTADGKWVLYLSFSDNNGQQKPSGKIMRVSSTGGPAEFVADVTGRPFTDSTQGGFPSFRCPIRSAGNCVLAEQADGNQVRFFSFDPASGHRSETASFSGEPDMLNWDLSPDGSRIAVSAFDFKAADVQIIPLQGGTPQKYSLMPWNELVAIAWTNDGKSLFLSSDSSRGSSLIRYDFGRPPKLLWKTAWDLFQITPSPDGHYLALGPNIADANAWLISNFPPK